MSFRGAERRGITLFNSKSKTRFAALRHPVQRDFAALRMIKGQLIFQMFLNDTLVIVRTNIRNCTMYKSIHTLLIVFACAACSTLFIFAQGELQDVVYLKNGSIIRGTIVEQIPNKTIKILTADNSQFVVQMDEIEKITKEPVSTSPKASSMSQNSPDRMVIGANPLGFIIGGVSWISYEKYFGDNLTFQIRGDLWQYSETENDRGYYYNEEQNGFGAGGSVRSYISGSQHYSGLFGAFGIDAVNTTWTWEERATSFSSTMRGDGSTMTVILSAQFGFALALSNVRIEPSIVSGYFLLREKGAGVAGVFISPVVQIGVLL